MLSFVNHDFLWILVAVGSDLWGFATLQLGAALMFITHYRFLILTGVAGCPLPHDCIIAYGFTNLINCRFVVLHMICWLNMLQHGFAGLDWPCFLLVLLDVLQGSD